MPEFVTAGGMRLDYLITHTGESRLGLIGGNALFAAVGAAIWDVSVGLWARIGENYPRALLQTLPEHRIHLEGLIPVPGWQDHRTFFAYLPDGRRQDTHPAAHFARIGQPFPEALRGYIDSTPQQDEPDSYEPLALRPEDWPDAYFGTPAVHLSPFTLATHLHGSAHLRQRGIRQITLDPGERYMIPERKAFIRQLMTQVDVFIPSAMEVRSLFGEGTDLTEAAVKLSNWGVPLVVIKNGAKGALIFDSSHGRLTQLPAYHQPGDKRLIDVTGAGDGFCGGFMVGLYQTKDPIRAARMGIVSASLVIEGYGATYALSRKKDAARRLAEIENQVMDT